MNYTSPRKQFLLAIAFMLVLVLVGGGMGIYVMSDPDLQSALTMARVAADVRRQYNDDVNWDRMFNAAMSAMTDQLDRYSFYIDSTQMSFMHEEFSGAYGGIGVTVMPHDSGLTIVSVRENGPAAQVGLLSGDIIIQADTTPLAGLSPEACTALLRGKPGTKVTVKALRPATADTLTVTVPRERIALLHVPFAGLTEDSVLYIRLLDFEAGAADDVKAALDSLVVNAPARPHGIILDLRDNPGGLLTEAYHTADLFLESGQLIVGIDTRHRWQQEQLVSSGHDQTGGLPMAVMVNRGSASAAEIVSGALRQLGRAIMVGDTTFGKGLVQGFTDFDD
ncbi:MAG: PDZ domain-containing protein, partial [Candidatus Zixiibacteriota bacterium]